MHIYMIEVKLLRIAGKEKKNDNLIWEIQQMTSEIDIEILYLNIDKIITLTEICFY